MTPENKLKYLVTAMEQGKDRAELAQEDQVLMKNPQGEYFIVAETQARRYVKRGATKITTIRYIRNFP